MDTNELRALLAVARSGSLHAAARSLGLPRSTLRRRIEELEARVGANLVRVSRRGVSLTPAGQRVVRRGQGVLRDIENLLGGVRLEGGQPTGLLRVGIPAGLPAKGTQMLVMMLRHTNPGIRLSFRVFEDPSLAPLDELDVYLEFGSMPPPPGWTSHEIHAIEERLLASRGYLKARGRPLTLEDLRDHDLLMWRAPDREASLVPCVDGTYFAVEPFITSPHLRSLYLLANDGAGILLAAHGNLSGFAELAPELELVLPEIVCGPRSVRLNVSEEVEELRIFATFLQISLATTRKLKSEG